MNAATAAAVVFAMLSISVMTFAAVWALGLKLNAISSILLVSVIGEGGDVSLVRLSPVFFLSYFLCLPFPTKHHRLQEANHYGVRAFLSATTCHLHSHVNRR